MKSVFAVAILPLDGEGCAVVAESDREEGVAALPDLFAQAPLARSLRFARLAAAVGAELASEPAAPTSRRFATGPLLALAGERFTRGEAEE